MAQSNAAFVRRVRALEADETGLSNPAGLAFTPGVNAFHVVEAWGPGQPPPAETDIIKLTPFGDRAGSARIAAAIENPINMAFDSQFNRLLIFQSPNNMLIEVLADPDGNIDPTTLIRHDARHFGLQNPQGMTVDPASGHLFILDSAVPRILRIEPEPDGSFDNAVIAGVDLTSTDLVEPRGLAFDPTTGHLHVVNPAEQALYELTQTGQVAASRNLAEFQFGDPQGMVFAPSGDLTDDPLEMSLYLADRGLDVGDALSEMPSRRCPPGYGVRGAGGGGQGAGSGEIVELSFIEPAAATASTFQAFLVQTIDASQWSPSSPDPSGIVYLPAYDDLLVSDGEVNEMSIFTGDNLFRATLTGALIDTLTTISFSDEPTGVTLNPSDGHLFFSDDTGTPRVIYEMNLEDDELDNTSDDDIITSFSTSDFGSMDPEGVTYDSWQGVLFIADDLNKEVYRVSPGANGIFDGIAPAGDDQVTSFNTERLGLLDPVGIAFNSDTGTLYIVGQPTDTLFEVTPAGDLLQTIDISAAGARSPAGLAYAPDSQDPAVMSIYIVDRGVDNDSDPDENDGKIYELTLPPLITTPVPPVANDDSASTPEDTPVTIDVAANDSDPNGNLNPTLANMTCPTCSEPANGSLLNNGDGTFTYTPDPDFTGSDSFVYEICDTGLLCDSATVSITIAEVTIIFLPIVVSSDNPN